MKLLAWRSWSLRTKLVTACVLVELVAAALVLSSSTSLLQQALREQATAQAMQALALLDQAVAAPLAQRDYATAQQTLDMVRKSGSIRYVVLFDHRDKQVAASGWDARLPLPRRDTGEVDLDRADTTLHLSAPIVVGGQRLGKLDLGLPTERLRQARSDYLQRILLISFLALLLSIALLAAIAVAVTRHLRALSQASRRLAAGDFNAAVQVHGEDEISQLGASFNSMAAMIKQRMLALEESEQRQGQHLRKARDEQARLTSLLGAMRSGILLVDARQRVVYTNEAFAHIWGLPTVPTGRAMAELVPLLMMQAEPDDAGHLHAMLGAGPEPPGDVEFNTLDGRIISQRMQPVAAGTDSSGGCIWFHRRHARAADPAARLASPARPADQVDEPARPVRDPAGCHCRCGPQPLQRGLDVRRPGRGCSCRGPGVVGPVAARRNRGAAGRRRVRRAEPGCDGC